MSTTKPVFAFRLLQEKCGEKNKDLPMVFLELEKAIPRNTKGSDLVVLEKERSARRIYVNIVQGHVQVKQDTSGYTER